MRVTLPDKSCPKCGSNDFYLYEKPHSNGLTYKNYHCAKCQIKRNCDKYKNDEHHRARESIRKKKHYQRNKEKVAARIKQYRADNPEKTKLRNSNYYERTREQQLAKCKQRKEQSPQSYLAVLFRGAKHRAAKRGLPIDITKEHLVSLWESQEGKCAISSKKMAHVVNQMNTVSVDRIDSSKGYVIGNVQLVCKAMNYAKNTWGNDAVRQFFDA